MSDQRHRHSCRQSSVRRRNDGCGFPRPAAKNSVPTARALVGATCWSGTLRRFPSSGRSAARARGLRSAGQASGRINFNSGLIAATGEMIMVDKGNTDKHRTGITGNGLKGLVKVVEDRKVGTRHRHRAIRQTRCLAAAARKTWLAAVQTWTRSVKGRGDVADGWLRGKGGTADRRTFRRTKFK